MATLIYGMNQSLDGYVDHDRFGPGPTLFRHFVEQTKGRAGAIYGRRVYELMHYWDDDQPDWSDDEHAFAQAWRAMPKWVVSSSLTELGPHATLITDDLGDAVRRLKQEVEGEIEIAGPALAQGLGDLDLIGEYQIYLHPVVLGHGTPYFAGPRPPLRLITHDEVGDGVLRLTYVSA